MEHKLGLLLSGNKKQLRRRGEKRGFLGGDVEARTCSAPGEGHPAQGAVLDASLTSCFLQGLVHWRHWRPARALLQNGGTTEQEMRPSHSKPLLNFICDKALSINPRTAHRHRGEGSNAAEREKQLEMQLVL